MLRDAHERLGIWDGRMPFFFGTSGLVVIEVVDVEVQADPEADWQPERWLLPRYPDATIGAHGWQTMASIEAGTALAALPVPPDAAA
jgi:hypothetical protein